MDSKEKEKQKENKLWSFISIIAIKNTIQVSSSFQFGKEGIERKTNGENWVQ